MVVVEDKRAVLVAETGLGCRFAVAAARRELAREEQVVEKIKKLAVAVESKLCASHGRACLAAPMGTAGRGGQL